MLGMLNLKIISLQPQNRCLISQHLKHRSRDVSDRSLYSALHLQERYGRSKAEWRATGNNQRANFCSLTCLGPSHSLRKRLSAPFRSFSTQQELTYEVAALVAHHSTSTPTCF